MSGGDEHKQVAEQEAHAAPHASEEQEEPEDRKEAIEQECMETRACKPTKLRFDACQDRVTTGQKLNGEEDCVEELFDLMHCVHKCAPEKYFHLLK